MRPPVDSERLLELARRLGELARRKTTVYLTGGASAVLEGWRDSTIDAAVRIEPESDVLLRELAKLKEALAINIELACPPDFIPELADWRERSPLVFEQGNVQIRHFDFYSQALAKIERGFGQDLEDVKQMLTHGLITKQRLREFYEQIEPQLYRHPAIDPADFRRRLQAI